MYFTWIHTNKINNLFCYFLVRLFNQGIDIIEVSDDGSGVPAESRPLLAVKHATSKIKSFEELSVDHNENGQMQTKTLGFRGEALFSLANISKNLIVSTRTAEDSSSMGEKMEFQKDGTLDLESVTQVARKVGTTVAVVKLFDALPVRRADLIKRIKSQRAKMLRLLQSCKWIVCIVIINFCIPSLAAERSRAKSTVYF